VRSESSTRRRFILGGLLITGATSQLWPSQNDTAAKNKQKRRRRRNQSASTTINPPANAGIDAEEQLFLKLINDYRAANGKGALTLNAQLSAAAAAHSLDMGLRNYFNHTNKQGKDVGNRASGAGYRWKVIGENLAAGTVQNTAAEAFAMWQSSPGHNQNMLDSDFREIGIGREQVPGSRYEWYWTTVFGTSA
jgi:uncharacterized protein YkwD